MSSKPLYDELVDLGYTASTTVGDSPVLHLLNRRDAVIRITIDSASGAVSLPVDTLVNQNPTLKIEDDNAKFCLAKGLMISQLQFFSLDAVAHESAEALVINTTQRLSRTDYVSNVTGSTTSFVLNHGLGGQKYLVIGMRPTNFDLTTLSTLPNQSAAVITTGGINWTVSQIRSLLVYDAQGLPLIPYFVKVNITSEDIEVVSFNYLDISGAIGSVDGISPDTIDYDWDGIGNDSRYEQSSIDFSYTTDWKALQTSVMNPVAMSSGLMSVFTTAGKIPSTVNTSLSGAVVTGTAPTWDVAGYVNTPDPAKPAVAYAIRIDTAGYNQIALLQWTSPDRPVLRIGTTDISVDQFMNANVLYQGERYIPWFISYDQVNGNTSTIAFKWGWAGLTLNNEWTVEDGEVDLAIDVAQDPYLNAKSATVFTVTDPTKPITVTINGTATTYPNYTAFLADTQSYTGRKAGLRTLFKNGGN